MSRGLRIVLLLLAASLIGGIVTGNSLYYRLSYVWAGLLVVKLGNGTTVLRRRPDPYRSTRTLRSQVGQIFEERFEVKK